MFTEQDRQVFLSQARSHEKQARDLRTLAKRAEADIKKVGGEPELELEPVPEPEPGE